MMMYRTFRWATIDPKSEYLGTLYFRSPFLFLQGSNTVENNSRSRERERNRESGLWEKIFYLRVAALLRHRLRTVLLAWRTCLSHSEIKRHDSLIACPLSYAYFSSIHTYFTIRRTTNVHISLLKSNLLSLTHRGQHVRERGDAGVKIEE